MRNSLDKPFPPGFEYHYARVGIETSRAAVVNQLPRWFGNLTSHQASYLWLMWPATRSNHSVKHFLGGLRTLAT